MKKNKHLKKNLTWIQQSDGSIYLKSWIFYNKIFKTEIDLNNSKLWNKKKLFKNK